MEAETSPYMVEKEEEEKKEIIFFYFGNYLTLDEIVWMNAELSWKQLGLLYLVLLIFLMLLFGCEQLQYINKSR